MIKYIYKILFVITLLCFCAFTNRSRAEDLILHSNDNYILFLKDSRILVVNDLKHRKTFRRAFDFIIKQLELCPSYPYASFVGYSPGCKNSNKEYFIYDLQYNSLYNENVYIDVAEKRWAFSGEYTYINKLNSFCLIPTKDLRDYLEYGNGFEKAIEIIGHPMGLIWQIAWIGDNMLYSSGIEGTECLGFFDTKNQVNYLLACCGMEDSTISIGQCSKQLTEFTNLINILILKFEKHEMIKISNDFFGDTLKYSKKTRNKN
jgi:hypothetical protein